MRTRTDTLEVVNYVYHAYLFKGNLCEKCTQGLVCPCGCELDMSTR